MVSKEPKYNLIIVLYVILVIFSYLDMTATEWVITKFGIHMELNPIMRHIMEQHGMNMAYFIRLTVPIVFGAILSLIYVFTEKESAYRMMKLAVILSGLLNTWHAINITQYFVLS